MIARRGAGRSLDSTLELKQLFSEKCFSSSTCLRCSSRAFALSFESNVFRTAPVTTLRLCSTDGRELSLIGKGRQPGGLICGRLPVFPERIGCIIVTAAAAEEHQGHQPATD